MEKHRKQYSAEFKLKVVLESLQRDTTLQAVRKKFGVSNSLIHRWRQEFQAQAASIFSDKRNPNEIAQAQGYAAGESPDELKRILGELTVQHEILKKVPGLLEKRFNQMAQQLVESMRKGQELIESNTRLEERTRIEQEMQTARLIQLSLLPKEVPSLPGWRLATYYRPAREVGGDLYDFLTFADGRLGLVIGDVPGKGVPAALVMATTHGMLRAAALASDAPGDVLARVNNLLYVDTPERIFVTCFYAILEPGSGKMRYANAGHDLPYQRNGGEVVELRASGMPLGLMPEMHYEEGEVQISHGESILFYSKGLVEAHNPAREVFGFPRLKTRLASSPAPSSLIDDLLGKLKDFTGAGWEQEDDVTLLTLERTNSTV